MSTNRYGIGYRFAAGKHPNGRPICRWCGGEVPKPRREYCSDTCLDERNVRANPAFARFKVFERDKGVCALCGVDTVTLFKDYEAYRESIRGKVGYVEWSQLLEKWRKDRGLRDSRYDFWDMDHIIPVIEGGGECGLENLRTLCHPCHRQVTKELHQRLKEQRVCTKQPTY